MSVTKRIAFGAAANGFSRLVTIALQLLVLPVLFHHLAREAVGVWLMLAQTSALLFALDFGLGAVLTRRIAQARGKTGTDPNAPLGGESLTEIADLVESGRRLYIVLAGVTFLVSALSGFLYLRDLHLVTVSLPVVCLSWGVLCLSQAFNVWGQLWYCLLEGVGYVGWDHFLTASVNAATLAVQIASLCLGGGLVALAVITALGIFAQRFLLLGFARRRRPELFQVRGKFDAVLVRGMVSPALRSWITGLSILVVLNTDQFFVASLSGAAQFPAYRAAYLVLYNLYILSVTVAGTSAVFISHLWQAGQFAEVQRIVERNLRFGLGLMAAGGACILLLGPRLFHAWLGPGNFIGYPILAVFFALLWLEAQSNAITLASRATEDEAFALWSVGAAVLKIAFALMLGLRYGLLGIACSTLLAEACTNHWYMVYRGLRRLRISFRTHLLTVVLPVATLFLFVALAVDLPLSLHLFTTDWQAIIGGSAIAGTILAAFIWCFVLEPGQRERLFARAPWAHS